MLHDKTLIVPLVCISCDTVLSDDRCVLLFLLLCFQLYLCKNMAMQFGGLLESSDGVSETSDATVSPFALQAITGGRTAARQPVEQAVVYIMARHIIRCSLPDIHL